MKRIYVAYRANFQISTHTRQPLFRRGDSQLTNFYETVLREAVRAITK